MSTYLHEIDSLRTLYREIIDGCSFSNGFYIKHLCELEQIELIQKRQEFITKYVVEGIPTEEERLQRLKESEEWTDAKEADIVAYRQTISDNDKLINTVIPQQRAAIRKIIDEHRLSLARLLAERRTAIGTTAEELADRDNTSFMAYLSLYRDHDCKVPLFVTWEEFEGLEESKIIFYVDAIEEALTRLQESNLRKISVLPFFLNAFSYSKDAIYTFLNKPIYKLTNYQIHLFSLGSRNLNILANAEGSPPEYFEKASADEILKWYDLQYSIIIGKRKQSSQQTHT